MGILSFTKRQKFFIAAVVIVISLVLLRAGFWPNWLLWRYKVLLFFLVSLFATVWSLYDEDFSGIEWVMLPILPVMTASSAVLVYPLLPKEISQILFWGLDAETGIFLAVLLKGIYILLVGVIFYAGVLTGNIFNVAAIRTIQLFRVAHSTDFMLAILGVFLWSMVVFSLHLWPPLVGIVFFTIALLFAIQSYWSINLGPAVTREVWWYAFATALVLGQIALFLSFWPVSSFVFSLVLTVGFYELVGIVHYCLTDRVHRINFTEMIVVGCTLFLLLMLTTSWTG